MNRPEATSEASEGVVRDVVRFAIRGNRRRLGVMSSSAFLGGIAEAVFLVTVTRAAFAITAGKKDVGIVAGWSLSINQTLLLGLALLTVRIGFAILATWLSARLATDVVARLRTRLARAFLDAEWSVQQQQVGGSLQELVGSHSGQATMLTAGIGNGVVAFGNLLAMLALAVAVDPLGALVMVVSIVVLGLMLRPLRAGIRKRSHVYARSTLMMGESVNEVSRLGMELHVFNVQDAAAHRVLHNIEQVRVESRSVQFGTSLSSAIYVGLAYLALLLALAVAGLSSVANLTSLGAVMLVMLRSLTYGQALQGSLVNLASSSPAIHQLMKRLDAFEQAKRQSGGAALKSIDVVEVERVSFAYPGDPDVLHDMSLTIRKHEIVGIVGPSGSGKSTLVQLLLGLRAPQHGRILLDGRDLREFSKADFARKVTFVPQKAHLIAGSIADNIRFLRNGVSHSDIELAARLANLHADIERFADGYGRPVGEDGGHLSGGQQQRLCIARALVERPDVLILDEPTSALDIQSEHLLRSAILELRERMTVIVIAHRLSTLDICDRIMVIQDGELKGFDTPSELAISNDFYREALELSGLH